MGFSQIEQRTLEEELQDLAVDLAASRKLGGRDGPQSGDQPVGLGGPSLRGGPRILGQPPVVLVQSEEDGEAGLKLEQMVDDALLEARERLGRCGALST